MNLSSQVKKAKDTFIALDKTLSHYQEIINLVDWDLQTTAPPKGKSYRAQALATLSTELFELSISDTLLEALELLTDPEAYEQLSSSLRAAVSERMKKLQQNKQVPAQLHQAYVLKTTEAHEVWKEARETNQYALFQGALAEIVQMTQDLVSYDTRFNGQNTYDLLLDSYEPGFTMAIIDPIFSELRKNSQQLLRRIQAAPKQPDTRFFDQSFDEAQQEAFCMHILPLLGFDIKAGRLDKSTHPFATGLNVMDVRITNRYVKEDIRGAIFGAIHECGHALYEQGIMPEFEGSVIRQGASMGIHESQSRFLENMIGRSKPFWEGFYPDLQRYFPEQLRQVTVETFYQAIQTVSPSLIRVDADELTYNLHIMIRYEIEKGLFDGSYEVAELPRIWNEKMIEYLGVQPTQDAVGVLQDVHWSFGGFGYFPSYTLGNLYAAQFYQTIKQQLPGLDDQLRSKDLSSVVKWLRENIHQYGRVLTPAELIKQVTGEPLTSHHLFDYFEAKYQEVYF
jgi:carboxypeptidase Taq